MIKRVDIPCFGSFADFVWADSVRDDAGVADFKRLNILYGRNYAGKTTLSRIVRCLEVGALPENVKNPRFKIVTDSGDIDQRGIATHGLDVRVYNRDFVDEHLGFLRDSDGKITPFAIVGGENKAIEDKIVKIRESLGGVEEDGGLRHELALKIGERDVEKKAATDADDALKAKLTAKATKSPNGIKHNAVYRDPNYNTPKIEADIAQVRRDSVQVLDDEHRRELESLLGEAPLADIATRVSFVPALEGLRNGADGLVSKRILPTAPLQELLDDAVLQSWVKTGMPYHRDKRTTCGFCGQRLPSDLWDKLDAHFSKESEDLLSGLSECIGLLNTEALRAQGALTLSEDDFYSTNRRVFKEHAKSFDKEVGLYVAEIEAIVAVLESRQEDVFTSYKLSASTWAEAELQAQAKAINALVEANNEKTTSLASDQVAARRSLLLSEIAQFIEDIDLTALEAGVSALVVAAKRAGDEARGLSEKVSDLETQIDELQTQLRDERKGAERVNQYLNHFFGHGGLRLQASREPGGVTFRFEIRRGDELAYNLSEGECSLVAFCYFIARLEDAETAGKDLIVYVDDPVSSLDSNHIFFVFSLIESVLGTSGKNPDGSKRYPYRQLFVSTHNLDFLKYLKCLSAPGSVQGGTAYFLMEAGVKGSRLSLMPAYLKDYVTEFNYLFSKIYACRDAANAKEDFESFYNFGNNLRKFLEAFLFYKYPCQLDEAGKKARMKAFFGDDPASVALTSRLTNELSHLEQSFDRSMRPIEVPEIPTLATFVLEKIFEKDPDQFNALLKSIGEPPRVALEDESGC